MTVETEDEFLKRARRTLDDAEHNLDAATVARLRAARRQALSAGPSTPSRWLMPVGGLAVAGLALAVAGLLWFTAPGSPALPTGVTDLELLTALEQPEFFAELEFYEWLEGSEHAG